MPEVFPASLASEEPDRRMGSLLQHICLYSPTRASGTHIVFLVCMHVDRDVDTNISVLENMKEASYLFIYLSVCFGTYLLTEAQLSVLV